MKNKKFILICGIALILIILVPVFMFLNRKIIRIESDSYFGGKSTCTIYKNGKVVYKLEENNGTKHEKKIHYLSRKQVK